MPAPARTGKPTREHKGQLRRAPGAAHSPREQRIGDWQIERVLGRGGTGAVYAVSHCEFGKRAALKISHRTIESGDLGAKVFLGEARVVQLIDHPAMPDVFATGTHDGRPYLVMERLTGENLKQLQDRGALDRLRAFDILIDVCDVLAAAHRVGVVHRDLKLDNVLAIETAHGPRVKLLDWGFARVLGEEDPLCGMIAGALNYVAPEQALQQSITPATDIYSLGVVAYRLLLGKKPFSGNDDVDLVRRHLYDPPPDPTLLWPDIPKALAYLLVRMLAKDPDARPSLADVRAGLATAGASLRPQFKPRAIGAAMGIALVCMVAGAAAMLAL